VILVKKEGSERTIDLFNSSDVLQLILYTITTIPTRGLEAVKSYSAIWRSFDTENRRRGWSGAHMGKKSPEVI
jgi:hypothetical protein